MEDQVLNQIKEVVTPVDLDPVERFFDKTQVDEFMKWMASEVENPGGMSGISIKDKTGPLATISMMATVRRILNLYRFIMAVEKEIFNPEAFSMLEYEQKMAVYGSANRSLANNLEFFRKFLIQNRDLLGEP